MFPHLIDKMNIRVYMRSLTAGNRRSKMELYLAIITPPPQFAERADIHTDLAQNKAVLVCDGGIDHIVTPSPPPNKASHLFMCIRYHSPLLAHFHFCIVGKNHSMESSENPPRFIRPTASTLSFNGFVHADGEWLPSFHISTSTVGYQQSTQKRNAKSI
jgi:hypothetical protein